MSDARAFWDARYAVEGWAYGTEPNDFLAATLPRLAPGRALSLGDGEGRNGVALAAAGWDVTTVDASPVGVAKALALAASRSLRLDARVGDLADFAIAPASWDLVVSIFCHLPAPLRRAVHRRVVEGLAPGGRFVLEAYTPAQLAHGTGGPKSLDLLYTLDALREDLEGLTLEHAVELERDVREGALHTGRAAVVQVIAAKP